MDLNRTSRFVRVVEKGSFTRAAKALGLPPSSLSRSVAKLEKDLGIALLERTTRRVALTVAGRAFFESARDALAGLEDANALAPIAPREVHGVVRVALPLDCAARFGPLITRFGLEHPRIRVELRFTANGDQLVGDIVDLAVTIGKLWDSSLVARRLGSSTNHLYAAPSYLEERGTPRTLAELASHEGLVFRAIGGVARWQLTGPEGPEHIDVRSRLAGDCGELVVNAAIAGLGVALLPTFIAEPHVSSGGLRTVLPKYSAESPLHVLTYPSHHPPRRVALLRDLLAKLGSHSNVPDSVRSAPSVGERRA